MRSWVGLFLLAALAGCEGEESASPAQLYGLYDLETNGEFLFIVSSNRNELRALDLVGERPAFARAPNPVEPLSVPVLDQPADLTSNLRFDTPDAQGAPDGQLRGGDLLAIRGAASPEISLVGADRTQLVELRRLVTPGTVTAIASRGFPDGSSAVYYGIVTGTGAELYEQRVPPASALYGDPNLALEAPRLILPLPGESVASVAVLPNPAELAVATRAADPTAGRSFVVDVGNATTRALVFGAPVRELRTHGRAVSGDVVLPAGTRVYGILDEASCGGLDVCRGIVAVDAASGQRSLDATGQPMQNIGGGDPLIRGFDLAPGAPLQEFTSDQASPQPLLGIFTTSSGLIYFFDAFGLRHFDAAPGDATVSAPRYGLRAGEAEGQERPIPAGSGPTELYVSPGKARDETVRVTFQGVIPGLLNLPLTGAEGDRLPVPLSLGERVEPGDTIVFESVEADCEREVASIEPGLAATETAPEQPTILVVADAASCATRAAFSVRALGSRPYVVDGSVSGYMGRVGEGETFVYAGTALANVEGVDPAAPQLRFVMGSVRDPGILRDDSYFVSITSGFVPYVIRLEVQGLRTYFAGAVRYSPQRARLFTAFPTVDPLDPVSALVGDFVVELDPASAALEPGGILGSGTFVVHQ